MNEKADHEKAGAQIDLIIDRKDNAINLCELKYRNEPFSLDIATFEQLLAKKQPSSHTVKAKNSFSSR